MIGRDGTYLRLTEEEDQVATRMDGTRSLAVLEADLVESSGSMDLNGVTELVADLREAGCLLDPPRDIFDDLRLRLHPPKRRRRALTEGGLLIMPAFYVDVTDAWLQPWRRRIAVSWAGPYSGFMLAGVSAILVFILPPGWLITTVLFKLAIVSYIDDAFNLMPLLKLDGYYILMDWLEIPALRERAMGFIKGPLWRQL